MGCLWDVLWTFQVMDWSLLSLLLLLLLLMCNQTQINISLNSHTFASTTVVESRRPTPHTLHNTNCLTWHVWNGTHNPTTLQPHCPRAHSRAQHRTRTNSHWQLIYIDLFRSPLSLISRAEWSADITASANADIIRWETIADRFIVCRAFDAINAYPCEPLPTLQTTVRSGVCFD